MSIHFRSLRSSSSGNCLLVWTDRTRVLIDCGLGSMKRTRQILTQNLGDKLDIDAVVVSHMHSDHIGYYSLRVMESLGIKVRVHESCLPQLRHKHFNGRGLTSLRLKPFADGGFKIGDLHFQAFEVPHNPWYPTYGFTVRHKRSKIVMATDFNYWDGLLEHFVDSDFIFVECNHDLELLSLYYNPNSQFHLPNPDTGDLLCAVRQAGKAPPQAVMLGHLSEMRNRPDIALKEIESNFVSRGIEMDFPLSVAPRLQASEVIEANHSSKTCVAINK